MTELSRRGFLGAGGLALATTSIVSGRAQAARWASEDMRRETHNKPEGVLESRRLSPGYDVNRQWPRAGSEST